MSAGQQPGAGVAAALVQLAALRDEVAELAAARARDAARVKALTASLRRRIRQPGTAAAVKAIRSMHRQAAKGGTGGGYTPVPASRWWRLEGRERAVAVARLRAWVETVFQPGYGHLAGQVGPCWDQHDLCLYQLAWLSEIHTVIFCAPERLLTSEADWHTRLLPAAVALMAAETGSCDHLRHGGRAAVAGADPWARAS
jgi:hypothetical protein